MPCGHFFCRFHRNNQMCTLQNWPGKPQFFRRTVGFALKNTTKNPCFGAAVGAEVLTWATNASWPCRIGACTAFSGWCRLPSFFFLEPGCTHRGGAVSDRRPWHERTPCAERVRARKPTWRPTKESRATSETTQLTSQEPLPAVQSRGPGVSHRRHFWGAAGNFLRRGFAGTLTESLLTIDWVSDPRKFERERHHTPERTENLNTVSR